MDRTKSLPYVTICTPTYNRRSYIKRLIKMVESQDYPSNLIQWIIVDDGEDKIKDIVEHIPQVTYIEFDIKIPLGNKRNISNNKSTGDIIVYMDDDDFYPPTRVSHAVEQLMKNPNKLCAGCSKTYVLFLDINEIRRFGPYNDNHATANTFAFRKELLDITCFDSKAIISEEKQFLNKFSIPLIQLDTMKTILVISHESNTFDKRRIIHYSKKSKKTGFDFSERFDIICHSN